MPIDPQQISQAQALTEAQDELRQATARLNQEYQQGQITSRKYLQEQQKLKAEQEKLSKGTVTWGKALEGAGKVAGIAGGVITKAIGGGFESAGDAVGHFSSLVSLIPGPVGAAAGAVTGVLGAAVSVLTARWEQMKKRVFEATDAVLSGSKSSAQAVQDIRVSALTEEFQGLTRRMNLFAPGAAEAFRLIGLQLPTVGQAINDINIRVNQTQQMFRRLAADPIFQALQTRLGAERGTAEAMRALTASQMQAGEARSIAQSLRGGATTEEARDLASRQRMEEQFIQSLRLENETREQTIARVAQQAAVDQELAQSLERQAAQMAELAREQELARGDVATRQLVEQNRAGQEQVQITERQTALVHAQGLSQLTLIDQSRELLEVQRLRARGLISEETAAERLAQLATERQAAERLQAAQAGRALVERNATERERMQASLRDLATIQARGGLSAEQAARAQAQTLRGFIGQARPQERLLGATEAGTAAAAVASARAEMQERAEDPAIALRAALEASRQQEAALERSNLLLNETYTRLLAEGAL